MIQRVVSMGVLSLCLGVQPDESPIEGNDTSFPIIDLDNIRIERIREVKFPIIVVNVNDKD